MTTKTTIKKILEEILLKMEVDFNRVSVKEDDDNLYRVNIESDNPSILIGHHGETIYALQNLLKTLTWTKDEDFNIVLDIDNYRNRQEENVLNLAKRKAEMVKQLGEKISLPPMSPYFRRIVHVYIKENFKDLATSSAGEGDKRHIVIKPS
ncbi:MAG: R3H domain-containing nucleic acid-binding protein [Patescibacteria group bacterium]|nr:KH domain-containing protein [Patescibacteria group bacterium]